jgi:uncharacterized protein (DUF58 family)
MGFRSKGVSKIEYARFLASALAYLSLRQHDAVGLIIFDNQVRAYRRPSTRPGHLLALLHLLERAEPSTTTNLDLPFEHFQQHLSHRGMVAVISDLYAEPEAVLKAVRPLAYQGQDIAFFHILDPAELQPEFSGSTLLEDMETGDQIEVSAEFARREYGRKIREHSEAMRRKAQDVGADYVLLNTSEPLDLALREYLIFRQKRR